MIQHSRLTITHATAACGADCSVLITNLVNALVSAGWSILSGGGTADVVLRSGLSPQGYGMQLRLRRYLYSGYDNIDVSVRDYAGAMAWRSQAASGSNGSMLGWASGRVYEVYASPIWLYTFPAGDYAYRGFLATGVPYVFDFLLASCTNCIYLQVGDYRYNSVAAVSCWRNSLAQNTYNCIECIWNTSRYYGGFAAGYNLYGQLGIFPPLSRTAYLGASALYWSNDQDLIVEPLMGWSPAANLNDTPAKLCGQLYDAFVLRSMNYPQDSTDTIDGRNWIQVTNPSSGTSMPESLWVRMP